MLTVMKRCAPEGEWKLGGLEFCLPVESWGNEIFNELPSILLDEVIPPQSNVWRLSASFFFHPAAVQSISTCRIRLPPLRPPQSNPILEISGHLELSSPPLPLKSTLRGIMTSQSPSQVRFLTKIFYLISSMML